MDPQTGGKGAAMIDDGFRREMEAGQVAHAAGDPQQAVTHFAQAVRLAPDHPVAIFNLGIALEDAGRPDAALPVLTEACRRRPDHAPTLFRLGSLLAMVGQPAQALPLLLRLREVQPDFPDAAFRCANVLMALDQPDAAERAYRLALILAPGEGVIVNNLAGALRRQGRGAEAARWCRRAVRCEPDSAEYHKNLGACLIQLGQWREGWPHYDWRCRQSVWRWRREVPGVPRWEGQPLAGKRILVHFEQGLGDTLQFIRYMAVLKDRGARTLFECQPTLRDILRSVSGIDELICHGDPLPDADLHAPLMSLPGLCGSMPATVPGASVPYLHPPPDRVAAWASRITHEGMRIGIHWQAAGAERSIPLAAFAPLAAVPGVRLFCLQQDAGLEQLKTWTGDVEITRFVDSEHDRQHGSFLDSAAIIANLDLVVGCDSAMIHLAGAMGKPAFLALPPVGDWRWMDDARRTVWYDGVSIFRADRQRSWPAVMERMAQAIIDDSILKIRRDHRRHS